MKTRPLLAATLLMLLLSVSANAQLTLDITKVTCRQYLTGGLISTRSMTLWLSGYYHGKRSATTVDIGSIEPVRSFLQGGGHPGPQPQCPVWTIGQDV